MNSSTLRLSSDLVYKTGKIRALPMESDEDIIHLYKSTGDKRRLGILLKGYGDQLFGLAFYYLHDRDYAMDTVMETYEVVLKGVADKEITYFKGWLMSICRNICLKKIRDTRRYAELSEISDNFVEKEDDGVYSDEAIERLLQYIPLLKEHQRLCIEDFYLYKRSYEEISKKYGMSFKEVKSYIQNGKRNLKVMFDKAAARKS